MPYDINIKATNAGTKELKYTVIPSPKLIPLTPEENAELAKKITIDEFLEKLKEKAGTIEASEPAKALTGYDKAKAVSDSLALKPSTEEDEG